MCSARYLPPLPLESDGRVLVYRALRSRPSMVTDLLDALRLWPYAPEAPPDRVALDSAARAVRALLHQAPRSK